MVSYFIIFSLSFINVIQNKLFNKKLVKIFHIVFLLILVLFIGTRHSVGGDWINYYNYFNSFETKEFNLFQVDFLFFLTNYLFYNVGLNIYFLNTFTALISIILITKYVQNFYDPKLAILISIPYILFVVLIGYNRQGIALCLLMYSITMLGKNYKLRFISTVLIASLFHFTSIIYLIFLIFLVRNKILFLFKSFIIFTIIFLFISFFNNKIYFLLYNFISTKWYFYVSDGNYFASTGVYYRLLVNLIPSIIFILFYKNFILNKREKNVYLTFSLLTILAIPIASLGTTFIDRIFIYFYPLQIYVFSNYNFFFTKRTFIYYIYGIFSFYFIILYVYFVYGLYSIEWIPYNSALVF